MARALVSMDGRMGKFGMEIDCRMDCRSWMLDICWYEDCCLIWDEELELVDEFDELLEEELEENDEPDAALLEFVLVLAVVVVVPVVLFVVVADVLIWVEVTLAFNILAYR